MDLTTLTAGAIVQLAFSEFIKSGSGEVAKKSLSGVIDLIKNLRNKIRTKLSGNDRAVAAIAEVEHQGTQLALSKVAKYLDIEMEEDEVFATEIRQLTNKIITIQNQSQASLNQQNLSYGRDQNIVNQPQGNIRIGGS